MLNNINTILYALAVDINCLDAQSLDLDNKLAYCLLANCNIVISKYQRLRDYTFYLLAFYLAYRNFLSLQLLAFLIDNVLAVMQENISYQNSSASVLSYRYFQAYSNIKRSIRYRLDNLLATKGIATGALALLASKANVLGCIATKQQQLLQCLQGQLTLEDSNLSKPFA